MMSEFKKYKNRGAYHWEQIGSHLVKRNIFVLARYKNIITLAKKNMDLYSKKLIDIGCGDGVLSYLFAKEGVKVYGIDYSDLAIKYAKKKTKNLKVKKGLS